MNTEVAGGTTSDHMFKPGIARLRMIKFMIDTALETSDVEA